MSKCIVGVSVALSFGCASALRAAPANDSCGSPASISIVNGVGTAAVDTNAATRDGPSAACGLTSAGQPVNSHDVWYRYVAGVTGEADISAFDCVNLSRGLTLTVFSQCGSPINGLCNGNLCEAPHLPPLTMPVAMGQTYLLRVASQAGTVAGTPQSGTATLRVVEIAPPANDDCENARELVAPGSYEWNDRLGSLDRLPPPCASGPSQASQRDLWFAYTAQSTGRASFDCGSAAVVLSAYDDCDGLLLACDTSLNQGGGNGADRNWVTIPVVQGQRYLVRVARDGGDLPAPGTFNVNEYPTPTGDSCGDAVALSLGVNPINNTGVMDTDASDDQVRCDGRSEGVALRWFRYTPQNTRTITFDVTDGMVMDVFEACGTPKNNCTVVHSHLAIAGQAGVPVYLRVGVAIRAIPYYKPFSVTVTEIAPVAFDLCGTAPEISPGTTEFNNYNATQSTSAPAWSCIDNISNQYRSDVWFKFRPQTAGVVTADTCWQTGLSPYGGAHLTALAVYSGGCGGAEIACNDNHEGGSGCYDEQSRVQFDVAAGGVYYLRVGVRRQTLGPGRLNLSFAPVGCPADFNGDSVRDVSDLFAYINAWLAKTPNADFNNSTTVDVADLFAYINAWLAGC